MDSINQSFLKSRLIHDIDLYTSKYAILISLLSFIPLSLYQIATSLSLALFLSLSLYLSIYPIWLPVPLLLSLSKTQNKINFINKFSKPYFLSCLVFLKFLKNVQKINWKIPPWIIFKVQKSIIIFFFF